MHYISEDLGLSKLSRDFRASLRSMQDEEGGDVQIKLAAKSQGVDPSQADTGSLCFSSNSTRMRATYTRVALAVPHACMLKNRKGFGDATLKASGSLQLWPVEYVMLVDPERGIDAFKDASQVSPSLHRLYNAKVAAATTAASYAGLSAALGSL